MKKDINNKIDALLKEYDQECEAIADGCAEEGYPSHGSNYELRCEQMWRDCYKESYDELCGML